MFSKITQGLISSETLSPLQSQVDTLVGGFLHQATDWRSLAAMTAGGLACRGARIGAMGLGAGNGIRALSVGVGLTAEVSAFELTQRGLALPRHHETPNLWKWSGPGGLRQGLLQSFITFGALKGAGRLARGENLLAQHLLQDTAMVAGHQATGILGIVPQSTGSLAEQFLHAEVTNLQLSTGMALGHGLSGGRVHALERGLDLSLQTQGAGPRPWLPFIFSEGGSTSKAEPVWLGPTAGLPEPPREDKKREGLYYSSSLIKPPGTLTTDPFGLGEPTNLERIIGEGRAVPHKFLEALIRSVLEGIPSGLSVMELVMETGKPSYQLVMDGLVRYRRLEAFHRLLAGDRDLKELRVIDNAPGNILDGAFTLARLGSSVVVKEPGDLESSLHKEVLRTLPSREIAERIRLVPEKYLDVHTPGDIVYWTNPCLLRLQKPTTASLGEYLARDVKPGGYLVIQSDHLFGTQNELLNLNLDPREWETVFAEDLPNFFPKANYLLPTTQAHNNLHIQVHRRKADLPVSAFSETKSTDTPVMGAETNETGFPYIEGERGILLPVKANSTAVILGDVAGTRTYALASRRHRVIHIDKDFFYLDGARNYVGIRHEGALMEGQAPEKLDIEFLHRDWFETSFQADLVEAFYPLDFRDLPKYPGAARNRALKTFLEKALNSKIRRGGTGYVVSEHSDLISDLAEVIEQDPRLEIIEEGYQQKWSPIVGGYGTAGGIQRNSWLIYRRK